MLDALRLIVCIAAALAVWLLSSDLFVRIARHQIDARTATIGIGMILVMLPLCYGAFYARIHSLPYNRAIWGAVLVDVFFDMILGYWLARDVRQAGRAHPDGRLRRQADTNERA